LAAASFQGAAGPAAAGRNLGAQTGAFGAGDDGYLVHGGEYEAVWEVALGLAEVMSAGSGGDR
jgi:hypothetical protein